ncbi:MAG: methyltransferase MtaB domain-containing protein [Candidatus Hadarchaeum sp.]|uniref:methyltransferase MtaB domain-containing protein n=1 Tax=Candidatus Hadarchaeum sp. TaxID=2883567 RepID=UPI003181D619
MQVKLVCAGTCCERHINDFYNTVMGVHIKTFTRMELGSPQELVFGRAKYPLRYGLGLEVGSGSVIPELKYSPRPGKEQSLTSLKKEYETITKDILDRAIDVGLPAVQLETEHVVQMTSNPKWGAEITALQKELLEKYHEEHGIRCALRQTIADIRKTELDMREGAEFNKVIESFELCAESGADVLAIESLGGKEVFDYAIARQDVRGILFSLGVLACQDMQFLWENIVGIARKNNVIPGGDTDCARSNTAMFLAGGYRSNELPHTIAAIVRAAGASRSLVAFESGATGPDKDCGYEGVIIKAVTGRPISQEGKSSACAHSSLLGNIAAVACDLWSNEAVQYGDMFGGSTPQVFTEILGYDVALFNAALATGNELKLRDLLALSDRYRDPQALILAPENAYRIGKTIVENSKDSYLRTKSAMLEATRIIEENKEKLQLSDLERRSLEKAIVALSEFPDDGDKFTSACLDIYRKLVPGFNPKNYGL